MQNMTTNIDNKDGLFLTAKTAGFLSGKKKIVQENIVQNIEEPKVEVNGEFAVTQENDSNFNDPIQIFNAPLVETNEAFNTEAIDNAHIIYNPVIDDNNAANSSYIIYNPVISDNYNGEIITPIETDTVTNNIENDSVDSTVQEEVQAPTEEVTSDDNAAADNTEAGTSEENTVTTTQEEVQAPTEEVTSDDNVTADNTEVGTSEENTVTTTQEDVQATTEVVSSDDNVAAENTGVVTNEENNVTTTQEEVQATTEEITSDDNVAVENTGVVTNEEINVTTTQEEVQATTEVVSSDDNVAVENTEVVTNEENTVTTTQEEVQAPTEEVTSDDNVADDNTEVVTNEENTVTTTQEEVQTPTEEVTSDDNAAADNTEAGTNEATNTESKDVTKHTIDEFEEAENEFAVQPIVNSTPVKEEIPAPEVKENSAQDVPQASAVETNQNPSSIFNIPLIVAAPTVKEEVIDNSKDDINNITKEENNIQDSNKLEESTLDTNTTSAPEKTDGGIDYFNFEFKTPQPEKEEIKTELSLDEEAMQFDFNSVIREPENKGTLDSPTEKIVLDKFLEPKENLIKKAEEATENDNNVIRIKEDNESKSRNNNKYLLYGFYVLLLVVALFFCIKLYKNATNFALTRTEITLAINSTYQAEVVSNSKIQDNKKYEWTSSNNSVATVDDNGLITSVGNGEATIFVEKGSNKKELKVTAVAIEIVSITFKDKNLELKVGDEKTLQAIINDDETIVIDLEWESSDPSIITVDENGHAIAVGEGSAYIQVYDKVSGNASELQVTVKPAKNGQKPENKPEKPDKEPEKVAVTAVALNKSDLIMEVDEYVVVSAVVRPANATDKKITWSSSNKNVATVSSTGKITAKAEGTTTITAKTSNGKKASIKVTVTKKFVNVTGVTLDKDSASLTVGETITLKATVSPSNATNPKVTWSSSDSSVASVSGGKVTAKGAGSATITVTTSDGNKKDVFNVTVKEKEVIKVTNITLSKDSLNLETGQSETITATVTPDNATDKTIKWSTNDSSIATVSGGKITAIGAGTATITATSSDGNKTATCIVKVTAPIIEVTKVALNKKEVTLTVGETIQLTATITPTNASDKSVTWKSSNGSVASVSEKGLVKALKAGNSNVTVKTANGKTATCQVKVVAKEEPEPTPEPTPEPKPENPTPEQ